MLREPSGHDPPSTGVVHRLFEFVAGPLRAVDDESRAFVAAHRGPDWRTMIVLLTTAVALTVQEYAFRGVNFDRLLDFLEWLGAAETAGGIRSWSAAPENFEISRLGFWIIGQYVAYVLVPLPVIWFVRREPVSNFGVRRRGALDGAWLYAAMFAFMFPVVWYCSTTQAFQSKYPFYSLRTGEPLWPRFVVWELLYAVQFVALEFFFRGFVLHGTRHRFGSMAIFVMMVPYCMIHFGKPMAETFGAIGAGIVLGFTSLKTRSIWLGACIHIAVAWTMDGLAVYWSRWAG